MIFLTLLVLLSQIALPQEHAIYRSVDRGLTWTASGAKLAGNPRINSFGATADRVFAGTDAGIYASGDGGKSWQNTSATARTISFATSGSTIYAGTQSAGLLASHDQGSSWVPVLGLASRNIRSLLSAQGRLYAGSDTDGMMVSDDQGMSWTAQNAGLPPHRQIFAMTQMGDTIFAGLYAKGLYSWNSKEQRWIAAGPVQPLVLAAAGGTLAVGHNPGGIFWSEQPKASEFRKAAGDFGPRAPVWEMASGGQLLIAGVSDGIFRSEDGGRTWTRATKGLPAGSPGVSFLVQGDVVFAGLVANSQRPARFYSKWKI